MSDSTPTIGMSGGAVLGAATAVALPQANVLPQTGSDMLVIFTISALVAVLASIITTTLIRKFR